MERFAVAPCLPPVLKREVDKNAEPNSLELRLVAFDHRGSLSTFWMTRAVADGKPRESGNQTTLH